VPHELHHLEGTLVMVAVFFDFLGLAVAWFFYGNDAKRAAALRPSLDAVHRVLWNKYYIDELYEAALGRPLNWISKRIFLQLGDRALIDGTLHGLSGLAKLSAGALSSVQTGSLHRYAFFVVIGVVAAVAWSVRHG
jgi:NADH-quinone oxidoreductase subunit L